MSRLLEQVADHDLPGAYSVSYVVTDSNHPPADPTEDC